ncbi:MAG: bifunctional lysine ketoglutarate reductase /saccharopine dehydrogenase family protein [candidate division WOR-3 bacterium]|nr:bifunctional lysine ketoglutarate reductase /saccharopine dehydrogenase family protein [candidate division WOR-3 bacterium]
MKKRCGIRREDKNKWEARVPLVPSDIRELLKKGIKFYIQPSDIRAFKEKEFEEVGAHIEEDLSSCPVIFGVKEMPAQFFKKGRTYIFFAHVIKGQEYNMPMLKRMMELECNLIDYERIIDENGKRLVFFGRFAGLAGIIDTLWAFGQRLLFKGVKNPFSEIKKTHEYSSLKEIKRAITNIGHKIAIDGLSPSVSPCIIGIAGYGNVSRGVQEILNLLPIEEISPLEIERITDKRKQLYKVVFKEEDMVKPVSADGIFDLNDYYNYPEKYRSKFHKHLPYLSILMNCIYWTPKYPRLVTKGDIRRLFTDKNPRLKVIGDISCDIEGSIEATLHTTDPAKPVFTYDPQRETAIPGFKGDGIVVMAIDNLPCELPRESSESFSKVVKRFVPAIVSADYGVNLDEIELPAEIKKALILHKGKLTPDYKYLEQFVGK